LIRAPSAPIERPEGGGILKREGQSSASGEKAEAPEKTLFIFRGKRDSLDNAVTYLRNRDWTVALAALPSAGSLAEATGNAGLLRMQPAFILAAVDQLDAAERAFARFAQQLPKSRLMLFCEGQAGDMTALGREMRCPYLLFPPVTGTAIERMAARILLDESGTAPAAAAPSSRAKSRPIGNDDSVYVTGKDFFNNRERRPPARRSRGPDAPGEGDGAPNEGAKPLPGAKGRPKRLLRAEMHQVGIEHLKGDAPVEFDLYLHLPANDKFILYTPEGKRFYQKQKDRLERKGVKGMHLKKAAVAELRRYRVRNFLMDRIADCEAESRGLGSLSQKSTATKN
jgi:hypothetical protein